MLRKDTEWAWTSAHQSSWKKIREIVKPTEVAADASTKGLGVDLAEKYDDIWKPVTYESKALSPTENRYV